LWKKSAASILSAPAHALRASPTALYEYLIPRLATVDGIRTLETTPVLRTVKAVGPVT
jgi:hypothetical protein